MGVILCGLKQEASFYTREITAIMTIKCHIMRTCALQREESCKVLSSNLT